MANILCFDTATSACSVALKVDDQVFSHQDIAPRKHAELLLPSIDSLLKQASSDLSKLDAVAVGIGPGSFMGVRIAVSVAQGLAFATNLPVVPLSTLRILAQTAYQQCQAPQVVAAWDARMGEVYWGAFALDAQGLMQPMQAEQLSAPQAIAQLDEGWLAAGNAWQAYDISLKNQLIYPDAQAGLVLAEAAFQQGLAKPASDILPNYLRNQVASH